MQFASRCVAIIPCHNEAATIGAVVSAVRQHLTTVIVVDDGSSDETSRQAQLAGAQVISLAPRQGKGMALKAGFKQALARGYERALMLDGDGQHAADDIPKFFQCAQMSNAALIVGNRMPEAAQMPRVRRWVNRWMSRILSRMAGQHLPDSQCGFRLLDLKLWEMAQTSSRNFEYESEMLLTFARRGLAIQFVPVRVIYRNERSKISPVRDTWRWLRWVYRSYRTA